MAIRVLTSIHSKDAHTCIRCKQGKLGHLHNGGAAKCPKCGCVHLIHITAAGNLLLTDKAAAHLFEKGEKDNEH